MHTIISNEAIFPTTFWREARGSTSVFSFRADSSAPCTPSPLETFHFFECNLVSISVREVKGFAKPAKFSREVRVIERGIVGEVTWEVTRLVRGIKIAERNLEVGMKKEEKMQFLTWKFEEARKWEKVVLGEGVTLRSDIEGNGSTGCK